MSIIQRKRSATRQPQGAPRIDWSNPLTQGLKGLIWVGPGENRNRHDLINLDIPTDLSAGRGAFTATSKGLGVGGGTTTDSAYYTGYSGVQARIAPWKIASTPISLVTLQDSTQYNAYSGVLAGITANAEGVAIRQGYADGYRITRVSSSILDPGTRWATGTHIRAVTHDGATHSMYDAGALITSAADSTSTITYDPSYSSIQLCASGGGIGFWSGIWNRALTAREIKSLEDNPWQLFAPETRPLFVAGGAAGAATYDVAATEAAAGVELPSMTAALGSAVVEPVAGVDIRAGAVTTLVSITEAAAGIEVPGATGTWAAARVESVAAADLPDAVAAHVGALTEAAAAADIPAAIAAMLVAVIEPAAGTDLTDRDSGGASSITESVAASDAVGVVVQLNVAEVASSAALDVPGGALTTAATILEGVDALDIVNWGGAVFAVATLEAGSTADVVASALAAVADLIEAAGGSDPVTVIFTGNVAALDAALAVDIAATAATLNAAALELAAGADLVNTSAGGVTTADLVENAAGVDLLTVVYVQGFIAVTARPRQPMTSSGAGRAAATGGPGRPANLPRRGR